ncbi:hypothetical protein PSP6_60161 [Paraburkholderia tropica]|nr:hypothetical protein PSP6_60161 [Paraburkholderia tropica]
MKHDDPKPEDQHDTGSPMSDQDATHGPRGPDDPARRRVLGGLAAVGVGLAIAGCETPGQGAMAGAAAPRRAAQATRVSMRRCATRCATSS